MDGHVRLVVEEVTERVTDRARLEQVGCDLVEQRLKGVVVVPVDEHDVDVGALQLPRRPDAAEAAAEDEHPRARLRHASRLREAPLLLRRGLFGGPAADAQDLGDRPGLERAAGRGVRGGAVGGLRDRAEAPVAEVRLEPVEDAVDRHADRAGRVDVRARSATARPCPGGRRRRARPGCRGGRAGRPGRRARASAARAASAASGGRRRRPRAPRRAVRRAARREATRRAAGSAAPTRRRRRGRRPRRGGRAPSGADEARDERACARSRERRRASRAALDRCEPAATPSARTQSAFTSTGLPARGVTGTPSIRASIQVSAQPSAPCRSSPSAGIDADPEARALEVVVDDLLEHGRELGAEVVVAGHRDVAVERVDEPERPVDRVVLERARCRPCSRACPRRRWRPTCAAPRGPRRARFGGEVEPLVRGHQVARPLAEPRVAGDRGRPAAGRDRELVGGEHELRVDLVGRAGAPRASAAARFRAAGTIDGGRRAAPSNGAAAAVTSCACPGASSTANVPAAQTSSTVVQPAGGLLARPDAAVPLAARLPAGARRRGRRPRRRSRRPPARPPASPPRTARRGRSRQVQSGVSSSGTGRSARMSRWTTPTAGRPWAIASSRSSTTSPTCQRQRGTPSSSSNETSSSLPRGSTVAARPLVGREPEAGVADDEHRVERGEPEHPRGRPAGRRRRAARGSGACAARRPCPSRSRRDRRRRATRAPPPRRGCRRPAARAGSSSLAVVERHRRAARRASGRRAAAAQDQVGDEPRPAGLVGGAEPGAVVAVEVLVEEDVVLPGRVGLEPLDPAEARPPAVLADEEERDQPVGGGRRRSRRACSCVPEPVGYSSVRSSPKKRA